MAKSIKRNFFYNILLNISKVLFPLITAPYVSRVLEPDGVGLFNFANTYAGYFALFAALGIPYYGIREVAKVRDDIRKQTVLLSEIMSISVLTTIVCTILMLLSLLLIPLLHENHVVFLISGIVLYITPIRVDWFFSGREEFGYITFRSLIIKILSVVLLFVLVRDKSDLLMYVLLNVFSQTLNELWNFIKLYRIGIHPFFTLSGKRHLKSLFVLFSSSVAISVYAILDTLMLGFMKDYSEVGYYNCATHISKALVPIATSLAAVVLPRIAQLNETRKWDEINMLMNKTFSVVGFLSVPIAFGVIAIAPVFVPLFFGEQFYGTIIPLQIIILTVIVIGFNNLTGLQILLGLGFDKLFLYSIITGAISNLTLNFMLIPKFGASGAAFSSVVAEIIILLVMIVFINKETPIRFNKPFELISTLMISSLFFVISYITNMILSGWWYVAVTVTTCAILYLLFQYLMGNPSLKVLYNTIKKRVKNV